MKYIWLFFPVLLSIKVNAQQFNLADFYLYDATLAQKTDSVFYSLSDTARVGQMFVQAAGEYGKSDEVIKDLIDHHYLGGVLMLNGTKEGFTQKTKAFNSYNKGLPLIFSADAEPSLINRKIENTETVKQANKMLSREEVREYAKIICDELKDMGINYNYAPVVDMSPNKIISFRSFGINADTAQIWANIFIDETQKNGIVATAKHFPGHGYVVGDTHKKLVYIDGEMKEVANYKPIIKNGVLSIMVAHIAVKNNEKYNTHDMPSTCAPNIVTGLLKNELKFKGLVITDALNMGGVVDISNCELKAAQAGCDVLLMPVDTKKGVTDILFEMRKNPQFKQQIYASVKKIIRLKICLGLI
ncbi:MAG: glycoside hydrolase family 3 N-terminal domain-containing protein [Putridiphycobacter sp.]